MKHILTVVIKFGDDRESLRRLIPSLYAGARESNYTFEVLAYSDGSHDGSHALLSYYGITHPVSILRMDSNPTCKELLSKSHGCKILFLKPDCIYTVTQLLDAVRTVKPKEVVEGQYQSSETLQKRIINFLQTPKPYDFLVLRKQTLEELINHQQDLRPENILELSELRGFITNAISFSGVASQTHQAKYQHGVSWRKVLPWLEVI